MNEKVQEQPEPKALPASEARITYLFDPFDRLFELKKQQPGDYRSANDGPEF